MRRISIISASILVVIIGMIYLDPVQHPAGAHAPRNLVLISIDTLRADRLGSYGYHRATSPTIDRLAADSTLFERAITPAPWTLPAHASMFSGLYPHSHGVQKPSGQKISATTPLLAEILRANGFRTIGVTGGGYVARTYGFDRGFDRYFQAGDFARGPNLHHSIGRAVKKAKMELAQVNDGTPYFMFFHTYDVHCPYQPPKRLLGTFRSSNAEEIDAEHCGRTYYNRRRITAHNALYLSDRYDEGIRAVDEELEELFSYLRSRNDFDNTVIVLTSDHGEEFLEHGKIGHRESLHKELLLVPLIIRAPGGKPQRIVEHVSLIDIMPTILELFDISAPAPVDGISLAEIIRGTPPGGKIRPFQFSELENGRNLRSRIGNKSHLILDVETRDAYFFNLLDDPLEQNNLAGIKTAWFERKNTELLKFLNHYATSTPDPMQTVTDQQIKQLQTLGYL